MLELIDQLRVAVPEEVRQARRITEESGRITERAREEGDAIVARAQEQAVQMLEERELVRAAQQRAAEILDRAQDEAREVRRGADEYAAGVLIRLEGECIKALTSIKRGIDMLDERHRAASDDGVTPATAADDAIAVDPRSRPEPLPGHDLAFNVAGLLHEPPGAIRESACATTTSRLGRDVELAGPIDADLRLQRTNRGILRARRGRRALRRTCSRCTDPYVEEVRVPISEEFLPTVDPVSGPRSRPTPRTPRRRGSTSITRSTWTPSSTTSCRSPSRCFALCRPDCPGLCATCGERLDRATTRMAATRSTRAWPGWPRSCATGTSQLSRPRARRLAGRPAILRRPRSHRSRSFRVGVPKRKVSKARQGERRAHLAISAPPLVECEHCHELKRAHHVCPTCGWYTGREAVTIEPVAPAEGQRSNDRCASRSTRWVATTPLARSSAAPSTTPHNDRRRGHPRR